MKHFFVNPDISRAHTISTDVYKSPEFFEMAKEKIFAHSWQFAGDTDMLAITGSRHPFTLLEKYLDEPLLLTKDANGMLHCLSNVCTHRGNLLVYGNCTTSHLRCKYHGRLFELDGKFTSMPGFKEVKDFPTADDNLTKLPLFKWEKLLFTSLQPQFDAALFLQT